jgi:glycosyltransferase involved in cell wall biosynthesis
MDLQPPFEVVVVPPVGPRTKPKALNYALLDSTGDIVCIYDAEDRPDPLQLKKVAATFRQLGPEYACVQAELAYFNADENLITRWFAVEYRAWFTQFLPQLSRVEAPIPLGGTSNHFRRELLVQLGAWDPYNVTEDADLGIRLHRQGYRVAVLDSVTYEEANTDFVNWIKQRSRWYKGYAQTYLVHMRHPIRLLRDVGLAGFVRFNLFVGGTPVARGDQPDLLDAARAVVHAAAPVHRRHHDPARVLRRARRLAGRELPLLLPEPRGGVPVRQVVGVPCRPAPTGLLGDDGDRSGQGVLPTRVPTELLGEDPARAQRSRCTRGGTRSTRS